MNLADMMSSQTWWALGSAVVQFVWQGALIGGVTLLVLRCLQRRSAEERYAVSMIAMLVCFVTFAASFVSALGSYVAPVQVEVTGESLPGLAFGESEEAWWSTLGMTGIAAWIWALGVCGLSLRFGFQCFGAHRLRTRALTEVDDSLQRTFDSLKNELGIDRGVRLLKSGLAEVPMVVGWLSPIVLLPSAALLSLDPEQLRALLAHELAHIRRNDHWLNAAQAVVEILLFFHPAVWWISRQVRIEREFCCDDSSLRLTGDPRLLAEALASMEALRLARPSNNTTLAANGGPLMQRITRILEVGQKKRSPFMSWSLPAGILLIGSLAAVASASATSTSVAEPASALRIDDKSDYQAMEARIKAAVRDGRLTNAEAKATIQGIRKSMGWDMVPTKKSVESDLLRQEIAALKAQLETLLRERQLSNESSQRFHDQVREQHMAEDLKRAAELEMERARSVLESMKRRQVFLDTQDADLQKKRETAVRSLLQAEKQQAQRLIEDAKFESVDIQAELNRLKPAHPQYQRLQQELQDREAQLKATEMELNRLEQLIHGRRLGLERDDALLETTLERKAIGGLLQREQENRQRSDDALEARKRLELALRAAQDREAQLVEMLKVREHEIRQREEDRRAHIEGSPLLRRPGASKEEKLAPNEWQRKREELNRLETLKTDELDRRDAEIRAMERKLKLEGGR